MTEKILGAALIVFVVTGCSSTEKLQQSAAENKCEEALENMPDNQAGFKLADKTKQVGGTMLSYTATGAAYGVQILWDFSAGVGTTIAVVPLIGAMYLPNAIFPGISSRSEMNDKIRKLYAPPLGKRVAKNTENWSCPNVDVISQSIRQVAQCYVNRGGEENRAKALTSLKSVEKSGRFYRCLSPAERKDFFKDLAALK